MFYCDRNVSVSMNTQAEAQNHCTTGLTNFSIKIQREP